MFLYLSIISNTLNKGVEVKIFCQIPGCNQETRGDICCLCGIHICYDHGFAIPFFVNTDDFWIVRRVMELWRKFKLPDSRWDYTLLNKTAIEIGLSKDNPLISYRHFYEVVVSRAVFPRRKEFGYGLCENCFVKAMKSLKDELNRNFFPILKGAQDKGLICQTQHEACFLDVVSRCGICNKYCCYEHIAWCTACNSIVCADFFHSDGYLDKAYGGCASVHENKHGDHLARIRSTTK